MHLSHRDHGEDEAGSEWADGSDWADSRLDDIAENLLARLDEVHSMEVSEQEWQRRHQKRTFQIELSKATPWYEPMAFLRMQPGVYGDAPRTPNADDRWISKRRWEKEFMVWRHSVSEKGSTFAAWKHCWLLARGLGGRRHWDATRWTRCMEWEKTNKSWHANHRIQQEFAKTKPLPSRRHVEHPPEAVQLRGFPLGRLLLAPRPEFIEHA